MYLAGNNDPNLGVNYRIRLATGATLSCPPEARQTATHKTVHFQEKRGSTEIDRKYGELAELAPIR